MPVQYADRFCIFLDVLGFKEHIDATVDVKKPEAAAARLQAVDGLISQLQRLEARAGSATGIDLQITQFSDSLVASFLDNDARVARGEGSSKHRVITRLHNVLIQIAGAGFLLRGGLSYGPLIHTREKIFGPALNDAYLLEKRAKYPRIMMSLEVAKRFDAPVRDEDSDFIRKLFKDVDGEYVYLNYLSIELIPSSVRSPSQQYEVEFFKRFSEIVDLGLRHPCEGVRAKYEWVAPRVHQSIQYLARAEGRGRAEIHPIEERRWADLLKKYSPEGLAAIIAARAPAQPCADM